MVVIYICYIYIRPTYVLYTFTHTHICIPIKYNVSRIQSGKCKFKFRISQTIIAIIFHSKLSFIFVSFCCRKHILMKKICNEILLFYVKQDQGNRHCFHTVDVYFIQPKVLFFFSFFYFVYIRTRQSRRQRIKIIPEFFSSFFF